MEAAPGRELEPSAPPASPWSLEAARVAECLAVDPARGLDGEEAARRRRRFGPNLLRRTARRHVASILLEQFRSIISLLLLAAAAASFAFGEVTEGLAIAAVVLLNGAIGFVTEWRAIRSMEALRALSQVTTTARRGGARVRVPAAELVPGDVVVFEAGDVVTADVRLVEASRLAADEASLTGESVPVAKSTAALPPETLLAERRNLLFKGTAVARGSGVGVAVGTGMQTELGRIASLVEEAESELTPLERRLEQLGRRLVWLTLAVTAAIGALGVLRGRDLLLSIETAIALAVAAVPEGLPIVATLALARGLWRMSRRNALVEKLDAVETLGSTSVILTDKTGTLTEGHMAPAELRLASGAIAVDRGAGCLRRGARRVEPADEPVLAEALRVAALCNDAVLEADGEPGLGDPTELALLELARAGGVERPKLLAEAPELREEAFDPALKLMATFHREDGGVRLAAKGAPEAILRVSSRVMDAQGTPVLLDAEARDEWLRRGEEMARGGMRVLALASARRDVADGEAYRDLTLIGLVGLLDPPRPGVREAIRACREAGIRVVMVTGDHAATARAIALAVGILEKADAAAPVLEGGELERISPGSEDEAGRLRECRVVARATPEQKLRLIAYHQARGEVVAMTGDGVNDAPALKKADIGVAMGRRGTAVAREAAALVLRDDAFGTIVVAVEQGRVIFGNIRKFAIYLLSCNASEVLVVGLASAAGSALPLLPLQILFLNLVTDVFPALALGVGEGEGNALSRPPRPAREAMLTPGHWRAIGGYAVAITAAVLGAFEFALRGLALPVQRAVTISFLTLAFAQLWHVIDLRDRGRSLLRNEITRNRWMGLAVLLCSALLLAAVTLPGLRELLDTVVLEPREWGLVGVASVAPVVAVEIWRRLASVASRPWRAGRG